MHWLDNPTSRTVRGLFLLALVVMACTPQQPQQSASPQNRQPRIVKVSTAEQQLLRTIQNAESLGQDNPLLLSSVYSLANFYHDHQEYDKAARQYQRALELKEAISGPNHPDVAAILQRYARVLQEAKRPSEAANLLARAQAILAQSPSPQPAP